MAKRVVTFGEVMLRLQPPGHQRFLQTALFEASYGGGEANVAISLAQFGNEVRYVTRLPQNAMGDACINDIRRWGVDTRSIARGGERLGVYFCEKGASQRPSSVIYDRRGSSFATARPEDFDWPAIFTGAGWFHFTGITPALSDNMAEITKQALRTAKSNGLMVSCDLNYRSRLWSRDKAGRVMTELMPYVDLLIANEEDAMNVFGITAPGSNIAEGQLSLDGYRWVGMELIKKFGFTMAAITLRESISASVNGWSGILCKQNACFVGDRYTVHIVDRVGGGDSFAAGLIHALLARKDDQTAIRFAVAASCLKHSVPGDYNIASEAEVEALMQGNGAGRVLR